MVWEEVKIFASPQSERQQDIIGKLFKVARIFFQIFGLTEKKRLKSKFFKNGASSFKVLGPLTKHQIQT